MILATVQPTRPLVIAGRILEPAARINATHLRSATNPTSPVVLLRGCGRISLSLSTLQAAQWSVRAYPLSVSAPPAIAPVAGFVATLSSDAIGFFSVHADVNGQIFDWFVRFIDLKVLQPGPSNLVTDTNPGVNSHRKGYVALIAAFDCTVDVSLRGSDEQPSCYSDITCGILQNLSWVQGQTLYGIYCARGTNAIKGYLFEPIPKAASPNVDAGDEDKFPLYDATEAPSTGSLRRLNFWDGPGIVTPLLYSPQGGAIVEFPSGWEKDENCLVLRKVEGSVSFRSGIAAKCKAAPHSYVVGGCVQWDLIFNQNIREIPPKDFPAQGYLPDPTQYLVPSPQPNGTALGNPSVEILAMPVDARVAGFETFGPEATKTTKISVWQAQGGTLI